MMQDGAESAEMVEKEAKRLEVLKRRQERELNQLVQYELMRKALQVSTASGARSVASDCCVAGAPLCRTDAAVQAEPEFAISYDCLLADEGQACSYRWLSYKAGNGTMVVPDLG